MICWATWSPRPGRELEAKPALTEPSKGTEMRKSMKITAVIGGGALVLATAGAAYAYWTTTGEGTGSATATTSVPADRIHIVQTSTNTGFYPGQTPQNVNVDVNNPAAYSQKVGNITVVVADSVGTNLGTCLSNNWDVVDVLAATENIPTLAANDGGLGVGPDQATNIKVATLQLKDLPTNQDNCKGAAPVLTFASAPGA